MEIQQHDGVVVEVAASRQGFAKRKRGGRGITGGREAPGLGYHCPPFPPLYIGPRERGAQPWPFLQGRVRPGGSPSPPRHLGGAFPL